MEPSLYKHESKLVLRNLQQDQAGEYFWKEGGSRATALGNLRDVRQDSEEWKEEEEPSSSRGGEGGRAKAQKRQNHQAD